MRDFGRLLKGLGAKARAGNVKLRELPLIAKVEQMLDVRGVEWTPAYEQACDAASLALFGILERDTNPEEPHPDQIADPHGSPFRFSETAWATYDDALDAWYDWQHVLAGFEAEVRERGIRPFWAARGYDVTDGREGILRCLPRFEVQMYAAHKGLLPGAKFTPKGDGCRAAQSVEEWGAALAAEAARFKPSR